MVVGCQPDSTDAFSPNFPFWLFSGYFIFVVILLTKYCVVALEESFYSYFLYFFDSRLIPTLFLILGWGYQPE